MQQNQRSKCGLKQQEKCRRWRENHVENTNFLGDACPQTPPPPPTRSVFAARRTCLRHVCGDHFCCYIIFLFFSLLLSIKPVYINTTQVYVLDLFFLTISYFIHLACSIDLYLNPHFKAPFLNLFPTHSWIIFLH